MNTTSLHNFVTDEDLMLCMKSDNCIQCINFDYTYCGLNQAFSFCN